MNKIVKPGRIALLTLTLVGLIVLYVTELYKLQILDAEGYYEQSASTITTTETVTAARGNLMDRYGRVLVSNRECYNIMINSSKLFGGSSEEEIATANAALLDMVDIIRESGLEYTDELPVTTEPPFEYRKMSSVEQTRLEAYLKDKGLEADTSAVELMSYFRSRYKIDNNYSAQEMRVIAGIRYEINVRYAAGFSTTPYVFVEDASISLISKLLEKYSGVVTVSTAFVREYKTQYAAHLLGYVSPMTSEEIDKYTKNGEYSLDAKVGRDGAELAFEEYLHGSDGEAQVTSTQAGTVISTVYTKEPEPGDQVYLTIDIRMQEATERALEAGVVRLQTKRDTENEQAIAMGAMDKVREDIQGAAAVVVDVKSGEPLAIGSYPTFNLSTFLEDYDELLADPDKPLFNRALSGAYAPGSTFKPCTAIASLSENVITTGTRIKCNGVFTKYIDYGYAPECWIYQQHMLHGNDNVSEAIRDSCNYFFYTVSDSLGIDKMAEYAKDFGLGESTGIELAETTGNMSHRENHMELAGKEWTYGDTLQAGIGQSDSLFTPLQLAEYCAAVANSGVRHSASILKEVRSYDFSEKVYENEDTVMSTVQAEAYNWAAVQEGMYLVAHDVANGSAAGTFAYYTPGVAAKTGTSQLGEGKTNNAIFICYAPYDDPEVAIAIVMERGKTGSDMGPIAKEILDAYFSIKNATNTQDIENTLLK
jgi:penicillin-binding protein 2